MRVVILFVGVLCFCLLLVWLFVQSHAVVVIPSLPVIAVATDALVVVVTPTRVRPPGCARGGI
jgi:hypothetical protein